MKKLLVGLIASCCLTSMAQPSAAQCSTISCENVNIEQISIRVDRDNVFITTTGDETGLDCTPAGGKFLRFDGTGDRGKNLLSAVLSAKIALLSVSVRIQETDNAEAGCEIIYIDFN